MAGFGVLPFGLDALDLLRIEAGLLLLDVDFASSRYGWTDEDRSSLIELGWGWMVRDLASDDRAFIGRRAIERELADKTSRWRLTGLIVDWADYDRIYGEAGLIPPKDHTPILGEMFLYDDDSVQVGYTTSYMYSPMLQRHIALARVRPALATPGSTVRLEIDVNHRYEYVTARTARLPALQPTAEDGLTCRRRPRNRRRRPARQGRQDQRRRPDLRRDRRRWRPQRADQRRLPRQGRAQDPDPRAALAVRWRGDHRGALPGLLVHDVLVRPEPAAAAHHPRPRADQARLHAAADVVDLRADGERRLPVARPGPRREPQGDRPPQQARRRRLQPVLARHGDGLPGAQAAARRAAAGPVQQRPRGAARAGRRSASGSGRWTSGRSTTPSGC